MIYLNDFIFKYRVAVGVNVQSMSNGYYILLILLNINILNVLVGRVCLTINKEGSMFTVCPIIKLFIVHNFTPM